MSARYHDLRERAARILSELRRPDARMVLSAALTVLVIGLVAWQRCGVRGCPNVERLAAYQPGGASVLLDRDGEPFADLSPVAREVIALDSLPSYVAEAFLAVEDQRFHSHGGVDWRRVFGAALADLRAGGFEQGFSTISMQLARNVFPDRLPGQERTIRRKILEVRVAQEIERKFTKPEILQLYLNHIYFGGGLYGIEAASRSYFGVPAARLTLAQAATLAAMPKSPNHYNPRTRRERARERRDLVLTLMEEQERIQPGEAEVARASAVRVVPERDSSSRERPVAPYFTQAVRRELEARFGDELYARPLRVHTTLDRRAQRVAEAELERQLGMAERGAFGGFSGTRYRTDAEPDSAGTDYLQGAVVLLHAETGEILALVGGRDFSHSRYDRAMHARRQVGSAFKPFVFAAALEEGYVPSQLLSNEPLRVELEGGEVWEPANFDGRHGATVSFREAAVHSVNVPTVRLAMSTGMRDVVRTARRGGIRSDMPELPSLALGAVEVSLVELVSSYTGFAGGGRVVRPRTVTRIEDEEGESVWESRPDRRRVISPEIAYLVTDLLRDALDRGTGREVRNAGYRGPAAGKTGTTNDGADAWFIGYTPALVGGVWIGFDRPRAIAADASGGRLAAPVWGRTMRQVADRYGEPSEWPEPDRVIEARVDPETGLVLAEGCRPLRGEAREELFIRGREPASICPDGEGAEDPGLLDRLAAALRAGWHRASGWVAGLFRRDESDDDARERERHLGTGRLPRASEISTPRIELDTLTDVELLGVPVDSLPPLDPDTPAGRIGDPESDGNRERTPPGQEGRDREERDDDGDEEDDDGPPEADGGPPGRSGGDPPGRGRGRGGGQR